MTYTRSDDENGLDFEVVFFYIITIIMHEGTRGGSQRRNIRISCVCEAPWALIG